MKKTFKPGDRVRLKSGSQPMTVVKYIVPSEGSSEENCVSVTWVEEKKMRAGKFYETHLEKLENANSPNY